MLSVLRHTKTPVKFWFLKNYLSAGFTVSLVFLFRDRPQILLLALSEFKRID